MINEKLILMFTGMIEKVVDENRLLSIAYQLEPEINNKKINSIQLTAYFKNIGRIYDWINAVLKNISVTYLPGLRNFLREMEKENLYFNHNSKCIEHINTEKRKTINWGLLNNNENYYVSIVRFKLEKPIKNSEEIFEQFYNYLAKKIYHYNGRIWNMKRGNVTCGFFLGDKIDFSLDASIDSLLNFPLFNSQLDYPENLSLQISSNSNFITYYNETKNIQGPGVKILNILEDYMIPNSIIIAEVSYNKLQDYKKKFFKIHKIENNIKVYKFTYSIGDK